MFPIDLKAVKEAQARVAPYIRRTPLMPFDYLSQQTGRECLVKCEIFQRTGSFKIRGAANCILENLAQAKKAGVIAASAGNHAQGVAAVCHRLGIQATIVMPVETPAIKVQNTQAWGARVELVGRVYDESFDHATELANSRGYLFVHPFHNPKIMAGQGTVALELLDDPVFEGVEAAIISVGGGGLVTGIASVLRSVKPDIKLYGVTAKNAPALWKSYHKGSVVEDEVKFTLAEGVAAKKTDSTMLEYIRKGVDDIFSISEESIAHAISILAEHGKMVVEGAGALPVAALLENLVPQKKVCLILSGGNIDLPALSSVMQRGLATQGRLARLIITVTDRPGGLNALTEVLAKSRANILQIFHQRGSMQTAVGDAEVEVDLETRGREHTEEVIRTLAERGFQARRV